MANKTTGSGQWTNMGNVTTNPDGSYSDSKTYNFLDMVSYEGGSYVCLENGTIGVRPSPGESTDRWFCSSVPGEATPDFKNLVTETKEAARTAKEKASDAEKKQNTVAYVARFIKDCKCYSAAGKTQAKLFPIIKKNAIVDVMKYTETVNGKKWYFIRIPHPTEGFVREFVPAGYFKKLI